MPTTTTPPQLVSTTPLHEAMTDCWNSVAILAAQYLDDLDEGNILLEHSLRRLREAVAEAEAAKKAWRAAMHHNREARREIARQGLAAAREELAAGVARREAVQ